MINTSSQQLYPLSSPQREIWFDQILHQNVPLYNIGGYVSISGAVDSVLFEQAVNLLVQKHDILRTVLTDVVDEDGVPMQAYGAPYDVSVPIMDFSAKADPHEDAMAWMQQRFVESFELTEKPLFRYDLVKISDNQYYWLMQYHSLIVDGYAIALLNRSLAEIYTQLANGQTPHLDSLSYVTFIENDRTYVESKTFEKQRQYWLAKYPAAPEPLFNPHYRSHYTTNVIGSGCESLYLERDFYSRLNTLAKQHQASLFHVLLGALYVYFTRTAQRDDFAIGLPVLNRANTTFKKTAGLFTGVTPTHFNFGKDLSFAQLLQEINKTLKANYRHQRFPVSEINRMMALGQERSQLFDISLSYESHDYDVEFNTVGSHFSAMLHSYEQSPLMIFVRDFHIQADIKFDFVFNHAYFNVDDIKALQTRFVTILKAVLKDSISPIHSLPVMTAQETQQLQLWNQTKTDYPQDKTIVDLFEQQVENTPDNTAVMFEEHSLSYCQLNEKANQLAHYLLSLKTQNGSPLLHNNPLIAIAVERSLEMIIGLLAILKAGGAYVPIDPEYPVARVNYMLTDSAAPLLLTQSHLVQKLALSELTHKFVVVCLDETERGYQTKQNPRVNTQVQDLAYVIYTSGSTGKPKGVMLEHSGAVNLAIFQSQYFHINTKSRIFQFASLSFDAATWEVLMSWCGGGGLQLASIETIHSDLKTILQQDISHVTLSPSVAKLLSSNDFPKLEYIIVAGEVCSSELVVKWKQSGKHFINAYGPTETTVCASVFECSSGKNKLPIGQPIANTRIYILDTHHKPQPIGIAGELCIAGAGLARGYLNRPKLTAEKFIEVNLFGKSERIYKTGDLARWLPDGNLEYIGRIDHQVKLRGFRIELGEIEAVLTQHSAIKEAVVSLYEADDNKRLVAYLVEDSEQKTEDSEWRDWLKSRLPEYMIPSNFTVLDKLPLTPNGKIDHKALPAPEINVSNAYEAPKTAIERQLLQIWQDLLNQQRIGIHDNFFELGGDSILSIQMVSRAKQAGLRLTPRDVFEHQSIAPLARAVNVTIEVTAEQGLVVGDVPLTPIQHWFFEQDYPEYGHFNQSILLTAPTDLKCNALQQAFAAVLSHHDALRLRYQFSGGQWHQTGANDADTLPFSIEDLTDCKDTQAALLQTTSQYQQSLNLHEGPITRLVLIKLNVGWRLFWCIHHLAVDGVSWRILQEDFQRAYQQCLDKKPITLANKTSSFKHWSIRLLNHANNHALTTQLAHWQALPTLTLPMDNPSGKNRLEYQKNSQITLDKAQTTALLRDVPRAYNTRINDVLLTALALTISDWTGEKQCLIDLEGHGRVPLFTDMDLSRTVGWFTTTHPVVLTPSTTLGTSLKAIKEQLRCIPDDGIAYGLLTQIMGKKLAKGAVLFNYLGQFDLGIEGELFSMAQEASGSDISLTGQRDHLLDINGIITQGQLQLDWSYSGDCYQQKTIDHLAQKYKKTLQQLIAHGQQGRLGVTPSDFPLAPITQTALDTLYQQYSGLQELYPLSPMQQGMLFHALYEPETGVYFVQIQLTLTNLDSAAFKLAWQHQLQRHPILRSAFLTEHQPLLQVVQAQVPLHWREHDWRKVSKKEHTSQLTQLLAKEREQGFDLTQAPLIRFDLIRIDEQRYLFIQHFHHILMDGWCLPIIFSEVRDSYLAFKQGQTPQLATLRPYRDYIGWLQQQNATEAKHYWQQRLAGFDTPTPLTILSHQLNTPTYHDYNYSLTPEQTRKLQSVCQTQRITLNTAVQGIWALLLSRYSETLDICFGVTISGRNADLEGIEQMIGLFINTLPLRIQLNPDEPINDLLQYIQKQHQDDTQYSHSPLFEIQANSDILKGTNLFESLLVFENYPIGDAFDVSSDNGYQIEAFNSIEYTNYPLTVAIIPGERLNFNISYDHNRISDDSIKRLSGHLGNLLNALVENPQQTPNQLPMLTREETQQLQLWNQTDTDYPQDQTIVDLFEQQVENTPDNTAVVFEEHSLSYCQLNEKANQLAHYLLSLKNQSGAILLHNNPLIAIAVERSLEMVIGLFAILKVGGAYVPIDPEYPVARVNYMLTDSAAPLLLTQSHLVQKLALSELTHESVVVCLDETELGYQTKQNPQVNTQVQDLAYVIYTSGSTGKPKGVMIEHSGAVNLAKFQSKYFHINIKSRIFQFASLSFDAATWEVLMSLCGGGGLQLASIETIHSDLKTILQQDISHITLPPSVAKLLSNNDFPKLEYIIVAGEVCTSELVVKWKQSGRRFINAYGPTETTVCASVFECSSGKNKLPIGQPIANTRIYILNTNHKPQPIGIAGELCIAGAGLARGYLNRPELTAEKFIEVELFGKFERIYKTGDLARWLPDGNLEYIGRIDHQVKLRGFRIELGEIEAVLTQHPAIKEVVVILYEADDNKRLVAYVVEDNEQNTEDNEPHDWLKARLPDYMIPSSFTILDKLPLTPNGKIDRKALPAPDNNNLSKNNLPRNAIELQLLTVWETILNVQPLGINDNFFDLGGHSLLAVKLMSHIQQHFAVRLPVNALFQHPTVACLAEQLQQDRQPSFSNIVPIQTVENSNPVYCLPGAIRSVMYLYPLASCLGQQQAFYALQTPELDGTTTPETVTALASYHLLALKQQQATGPYQLVGHSSGGQVAFEMARQLEQQGETIALLAILDTSAPNAHDSNAMIDNTEWNGLADIVLVFEELTGHALNLSLQYLQTLPDIETAYTEVMNTFLQYQILFAPNTPVDELKALVNTYRITVKGHSDYTISTKLNCPLHLFRASETMQHPDNTTNEDSRKAWGWADCTHATVEEHWVSGTHVTMMSHPQVKTLAEQLSQYLSDNKAKDPSC